MTTLYYFAVNGLLVAGTGNKVEDFGVGFYTKYGDGGVDLSPIADLMKSKYSYLQLILKFQSQFCRHSHLTDYMEMKKQTKTN
jgi:NAD+ synthase